MVRVKDYTENLFLHGPALLKTFPQDPFPSFAAYVS